jgi:hypothetical protein
LDHNWGCDVTEGWIENDKGNWVLICCSEVEATVYYTNDGWGGIWNGARGRSARRLKAKFNDAEDARTAMETAIGQGPACARWKPPDDEWLKTKVGGYYRRVHRRIVSVKQAKSKSWYAVNMDGALLGSDGSSTWFATAEEACSAVDACAGGRGSWRWITCH